MGVLDEQRSRMALWGRSKKVELVLTCGCKSNVRDIPNKNAFMSCGSGLGHGHKQRWVTGTDHENGYTYTNNWLPQQKEGDVPDGSEPNGKR